MSIQLPDDQSGAASSVASTSSLDGASFPSVEVARLLARARRTVAECAPQAAADDARTAGTRLLQSCTACRKLKAKCSGPAGGRCERCEAKGLECTYLEQRKMGRKISSKGKVKMLELQDDLERLHQLLQPQLSTPPPPSVPPSATLPSLPTPPLQTAPSIPSPLSAETTEEDPLASVLTNPLNLLTLSSEEPSSATTADPPPPPPSLFDHVFDADPELDPVHLGLLSEEDFERLLAFYYANQQLYLHLLDPALHTAFFLRRTSPFLTTVVALCAAPFDPSSTHLVPALEEHARRLSIRAFIDGYKSVEVVLAFTLYSTWSPAVERPSDDRSWRHISQAVRYGGEIRLDLPLKPHHVTQYEELLAPQPVSPAALDQARLRTHEAIFCINLAICIQTGRLVHVIAIVGPEDDAAEHPAAEAPSSPDKATVAFFHTATIALSLAFAKALSFHTALRRSSNHLPPDARCIFNRSWKADLAAWDQRYGSTPGFHRLSRINRTILALCYSLRFPGDPKPILEECRHYAVEGVRYVIEWFKADPRVLYATNFFITNIAYCSSFLLRNFLLRTTSSQMSSVDSETVSLCWEVVRILDCISSARLHGRSLAAVYAGELRTLLTQLPHPSLPVLPSPPPGSAVDNLSTIAFPNPASSFDTYGNASLFSPTNAAWPLDGAVPGWPGGDGYYDALFSTLPSSLDGWSQ
ncbi:hypothetical protein JCM6882_001840 [Rhodosporidiobolus microsporus]